MSPLSSGGQRFGEGIMEWVLPLVGGLGLGSLLKSVIDHFNAGRAVTKDRLYQEKREAYLGLLGALHKAAVQPSKENSKEFALWQTRCQLFGSLEVAQYVQAIIDSNEGPRAARETAFKGMIEAMRTDLRR
jgi:hypothetical protein